MNLITSVALWVNGAPLIPPASSVTTLPVTGIILVFNFSRLIVVLVAIIPDIRYSLIKSSIEAIASFSKSGAILTKMGFSFILFLILLLLFSPLFFYQFSPW